MCFWENYVIIQVMMDLMDIMTYVSGGCMVDTSTDEKTMREAKRKWLEENAKGWTDKQKETFIWWGDWNMIKNEWVMSPSKVAEILGCSAYTIQKKCKDGKIKAYQNTIGWWHIPMDQVLAML